MLTGFCGDWMSTCIEQLVPYTERCEGSFIELKEASLVWQYRDCDPELGKRFATVITSDFEKSLKSLKMKVINGKGYVEVLPEGINKGAFASFILKQEVKKNRPPDFILAIGDDTADEHMFNYLNEKKNKLIKYINNPKVFTVTVGKKPSKAESYLDSTSDVRSILDNFMQISNRKAMSSSTFNIRGFKIKHETSTTLTNEVKNFNFIEEYNSDYSDGK
jgi:trehalose 6-phosphate synthase/phosphatase